ncbi:MAG TPA: hypothetical protein VMV49_15005 [Candidatus Deferrimicrobium sp.]|nr:hypothetical protein [Candidatus Deferrimicrobium sp.]
MPWKRGKGTLDPLGRTRWSNAENRGRCYSGSANSHCLSAPRSISKRMGSTGGIDSLPTGRLPRI